MSIKKVTAHIVGVTDLSKTAKDVTFALPHTFDFVAGQFINVFMDIDGATVRRAFSISSSDREQNHITVSIREIREGTMSPLFWENDLTGTALELMGPLGVNTANKMRAANVYLFAYGIGAGVVKSVLDHVIAQGTATRIVVMTGSRTEEEIIHREYFDRMTRIYPYIEVRHVVSQIPTMGLRNGYIQDHIDGIDFNDADVYACGQESACESLVSKIRSQNPQDCNFFIEAFH